MFGGLEYNFKLCQIHIDMEQLVDKVSAKVTNNLSDKFAPPPPEQKGEFLHASICIIIRIALLLFYIDVKILPHRFFWTSKGCYCSTKTWSYIRHLDI